MDIKSSIQKLVENQNFQRRTRFLMIEKLIAEMFSHYLSTQGKTYIEQYRTGNLIWDGYVSNGFDNYEGDTAIEIKIIQNSVLMLDRVFALIGRGTMLQHSIKNLIFIFVGEVRPEYKRRFLEADSTLKFKIYIWDIDDLVQFFDKDSIFYENTYKNLYEIYIKQLVKNAFDEKRETYNEKREKYIRDLQCKYAEDKLVLFLGAGVSVDAKVATWDDLISELFVELIDRKLSENGIEIDEERRTKLAQEAKKQNTGTPLLQARFLKEGMGNEFEEIVRKILYKNVKETSALIEAIGRLCVPKRGKFGIKAIVSYNFDDLIEKEFKRIQQEFRSVYNEEIVSPNELGIYHVHGFLPNEKSNEAQESRSLLVFSEDGYHKLMRDSYNWVNLLQLNFFVNDVCLFVGLSMTDPNLRRLLDVSAQRDSESECRHYAIMKRFSFEESKGEDIKKFEQINEELQEAFYRGIGVNIIWIDQYEEIPKLLDRIKNNLKW